MGHLGVRVLLIETGVKGHGSAVLLRRFVFLAELGEKYPGRKSLLSSLVSGISLFLAFGFSFLGV